MRLGGRRVGGERGTSQVSQPLRPREKSLNRILERLNPPVSVLDGNHFFPTFPGEPLAVIRHPEA